MNKNKIIFLVITGIIVLLIILGLTSLNSEKKTPIARLSGAFDIWMFADESSGMQNVLLDFKALNPNFESQVFNVVTFDSYEEYTLALASALSKGEMPDIFMLSNNEAESLFMDQIVGIPSEVISANDFRKKYKGIFADDLIVGYQEGDDKKEIIAGLPVGYETLGIYFNRKFVKASDLESIPTLNNKIRDLKRSKPGLIPIAIGNGSTVRQSYDILTQLFVLEDGVSGLGNLVGAKAKQALSSYFLYGDLLGDNGYDASFANLSSTNKDNYNLFSQGDTYMVAGYPRDLEVIKKKGFSKSFLLASPFPHYFAGAGKTLANYNYFVLNKDSQFMSLSHSILQYLSSDRGAEKYLDEYPYYLPALLSLESDKLEKKVDENYNVSLSDFYNPDFEITSFNKGIKYIYDREIQALLDDPSNYVTSFESLRSKLICQSNKFSNLANISSTCE